MAFADVTNDTLKELLKSKDSSSTKRSVQRSVKLFREFLISKGKSGDFESFDKTELNQCLSLFYASVRKRGGDYMKKSSIHLLKYGLTKHLKDTKNIDMKNDDSFSSCNDVFAAVLTDLKKKGFGSVAHKPPIFRDDLSKLYHPDNMALNINTPTGLQNKVWLDIMMYLCRRGRENLREMTKDTFIVNTNGSGRRYVTQAQDENDKNHKFSDGPNETVGEGTMYERPGDPFCPVVSYVKYLSKLHPDNEALWQKPLDSYIDEDIVWYSRVPVGKNSLSAMMSTISKLSKLSISYTNHSIRATSIKEMDEAGIEARHIMRVSGHKSESSIRSYSQRLSDEKKQQISDCLGKTLTGKEYNSVVAKQSSASNVSNLQDIDFLSDVDLNSVFSNEFELEEVHADDIVNIECNITNTDAAVTTSKLNSVPDNTCSNNNTVNKCNSSPSQVPVHFSSFMGQVSGNTNTSATFNPYITNCTVNFNFYSK